MLARKSNPHTRLDSQLLWAGEKWRQRNKPSWAKGDQPGVERSIEVWCEKQSIKWIQALRIVASPPRLDVRGNKKPCVLVASNRASLPISYEFLAERALADSTLDEVVSLGWADSGVVKDGIYVCLDITQITDTELASLNLKPANFHGEWNYAVLPNRKRS